MVNKSIDQQFNKDWEKAAAWAQTLGIKQSDLLPVAQYDQQRVAQGDYPMSPAERNRAILAAHNPNNVTPVPSDKPSPLSLLGNARTDLRNIFTGLAPNHLIPNIFHTAETAILHPSTWVKPVEEVAKGALTGNVKEVKAGLTDAGSQNSILSWIPGVYDLSEFAKGGVNAVLEHPIVSLLDVAPFAPAGKVLSLAADESKMATIAGKLGMGVDDLYKASLPQMASKFIMSRDLAKDVDGNWKPRFPGAGLLSKTLVDKDGKPLTVSGAFQNWGMSHNGLAKGLSYVAASAFDLRAYGTDAEMYTMIPLEQSLKKLNDPAQRQQLHDLVSKTDPRAQGKTSFEVMKDESIDPDVRDAYSQYQDVLAMGDSQALAGNGMVAIAGPDITLKDGKIIHYTDYYGVTGEASTVVSAARQSTHSLMNLVKAMGPAHKITQEVAQLDQQFSDYARQTEVLRKQAAQTPVAGQTIPRDLRDANGKVLRKVALPLERQRDLLMSDDGLISKALEAGSKFKADNTPKDADFVTMKAILQAAKRDLSQNGFGRLDANGPKIDPVFGEVARRVDILLKYTDKRIERERAFLKEMAGDVPKRKGITRAEATDPAKRDARIAHNERRHTIIMALKKAEADYRHFQGQWWHNPADAWRPVLYDAMIEKILSGEDKVYRTEEMVDRKREIGWTDKQINELRSNPLTLAQAIWQESKMAASNPGGRMILDQEDIERVYNDAIDHVNQLRAEGHEVQYVPVLTSLDVSDKTPGRYGITLSKGGTPRGSSTKARKMSDFMPERYDLLASVHQSVKEAIERNMTIEFANEHLMPAALTAGEVDQWVQTAFRSEFAGRDARMQNLPDAVAEKVARRLGLKKWDPNSKMGFTFPRWGNDAVYLPAGLADAVDKLLGKEKKLPLEGVYDKATNAFRFSILALSPRYTAHIVFGGAFLLALRSDPRIVTKMGEGWRMAKEGSLPIRLRQSATEIGKASLEYPSFADKTPLDAALTARATNAGSQLAHMGVQEILGKQGIIWSKASPLQWIKAVGEANYRFTNRVSTMYRAASYLDASDKAIRDGVRDPVTGQKVKMSPERAKEIGMQHALKTMGDLKAMTPLERSTFMRIMPFYGWTRHILNYVLTYPADHPYRAQFLTVLANQDSDSVAKALDTRILFMFFFGSPTQDGNVSGVDVRFLDPLRDVGNYASLSGWIQALNPVIEAPLAMIDPNLIYGSTSLYPSVTYDQFYGIQTTTNPTGALNAIEQIIPQTGALATAMNLAGNSRNLAVTNPNQFAKQLFESLNIPFAQIQNVNMKALAAKGEIARYDVAKAAALNAWESPNLGGTGVEQALSGYSSVPSPLNPDYEMTPAQLQAVYNSALATFPGQNPADVIGEPQAPAGY